MPDQRPLYIILEIQPDATPEEIKRAYHRLALQYHPDRAGPESGEKFQQILAAYTLLKDPEAREVYDRYGEQGLSNMEAMPAMADAAQHMDKVSFFRLMFAMVFVVSAVSIVLFVILSMKLDEKTDVTWYGVLAPGYSLLSMAVLSVGISICFRLRKYRHWYKSTFDERDAENENPAPPAPSAMEILRTMGYAMVVRELQFWVGHVLIISVSTSILLLGFGFAQREQPVPVPNPISWWSVYSPAIAGNALSFVSVPVLRSLLRLQGIHEISTGLLVTLNGINILLAILRTLQIVLIVVVIEGKIDLGPELWSLPAELYFALSFVMETLLAIQRTHGIRKIDRETPYMSEEDKAEKIAKSNGMIRSMWAEILFWLYVNGLVIIGILLATRAGNEKSNYAVAFIPFFILFGSLFFSSLFLFICFTIFIESEAMEKRDRDRKEKEAEDGDKAACQDDDGAKESSQHEFEAQSDEERTEDAHPNTLSSPIRTAGKHESTCFMHQRDFEEMGEFA